MAVVATTAGCVDTSGFADYEALTFGEEFLNTNELSDLQFTAPDNYVAGTDAARPVLMFVVRPRGDTNIVVRVGQATNGRLDDNDVRCAFRIGTGDNDDEQWRTLHCAIDGTLFSSGQTTDIHILPVTGSTDIKEVVLLFQKTVL